MLNNILEISKRASKNGRVPIKIALLKIHNDSTSTKIDFIGKKNMFKMQWIV